MVDVWSGGFPWVRAARLTSQLPDGARVWKAVGADQSWSSGEYMLALMIDILNHANHQRAGGKGASPKPYPRPSELKERADKHERRRLQALEAKRRLTQRRIREARG